MTDELKKLVRGCAFELMKDESNNGYILSKRMPGVEDSETARKIGEELCRLGILKNGWIIAGRNHIQGYVDKDRLTLAIQNGELG